MIDLYQECFSTVMPLGKLSRGQPNARYVFIPKIATPISKRLEGPVSVESPRLHTQIRKLFMEQSS